MEIIKHRAELVTDKKFSLTLNGVNVCDLSFDTCDLAFDM